MCKMLAHFQTMAGKIRLKRDLLDSSEGNETDRVLRKAQGKYWEDVADGCLKGHHHPRPFILIYLPRHLCQPCNKGPPCPCAVAAGEKPQGSALQRDPQNNLIHPTMKVRWLSPCMVAILIIISYFRQNEVDRHQGGKMSEVISLLDRPSGGALHSSDGPYYRENHLSRA